VGTFVTAVIVIVVLFLPALVLSVRIVQQDEQGVLFRLGRVIGARVAPDHPVRRRAAPGLAERPSVSGNPSTS